MIRRCADGVVAVSIFALTLVVFLKSPMHQLSDSRYALVLTESLVRHATFDLSPYLHPPFDPREHPNLEGTGYPMNLQTWDGRVFYGYPVGTSILSAPLVVLLQRLGVSSFRADGSYSQAGEEKAQGAVAALVMAGLAVVWYFTARLLLPIGASVVIAAGGALGTQVWSTASRGLWAHTWLIFLLGGVIWLLVRMEVGDRRLQPAALILRSVLLATLLSWMYFVRPDAAIPIAAVTVWLLITHRRGIVTLVLTGGVWLGLFILYARHVYGTNLYLSILPVYYDPGTHFNLPTSYWGGLLGVVLSPSRGLLPCVPATLFVVYLVVRYLRALRSRSLAWLGLGVTTVQVGMLASFWGWDGGACFGPRYLTDAVPWLVLLAILGARAWIDASNAPVHPPGRFSRMAELAVGLLLLAVSIFINGRGATSIAVWQWNAQLTPSHEERRPRVMDWRYPQWLAGLIPPPLPPELHRYVPGTTLELGAPGSEGLLREGFGWSGPEGTFRRTDGTSAHVVFGTDPVASAVLEMSVEPFLTPRKLETQRLVVRLNGALLATLVLRDPSERTHAFPIPAGVLKEKNVLVLETPDATSPAALGLSRDRRRLGVKVFWVRISSEPERSSRRS